MYSNIVYLYGNLFAPETNVFHFREDLPNGKKVDQKKLAVQLVLSALCYLYSEKLADFYIEEGKTFFLKTKTLKIKKLKNGKLNGLEKELLEHLKSEDSVKSLVSSIVYTSENPWEVVTIIVRKNIRQNKIAKNDSADEKNFNSYTKALNELKAKESMNIKIREAIEEALESKEERERGENGE